MVAADEKAVNGAQGGEAGADDADGIFDDGPDDGVDVSPWALCGLIRLGWEERGRGNVQLASSWDNRLTIIVR